MCFRKETGVPAGGLEPVPAPAPGPQSGQVETYSGHRLHERPRRFIFHGEWLEVAGVLSQWQEPENLTFLVLANDSRQYVLKYHYLGDAWEVCLWRRSGPVPR